MCTGIQRGHELHPSPIVSRDEGQEIDHHVLQNAIQQIYQTVLNGSFFQNLHRKADWVWKSTVEAIQSEWGVITLVAFAAYAAFGFAAAVQSMLIFACARMAVVAWKDQGIQKNLDRLNGEILNLRIRNEELVSEMEIARRRADHAHVETEAHQQELARVQADRDRIILERAPILNDNEFLREQNISLLQQTAENQNMIEELHQQMLGLQSERNEAIIEMQNRNGMYLRALDAAQAVKDQTEKVETFKKFNELLSQFLDYFKNQNQNAVPDLESQLFSQYRQSRIDWNKSLFDHIQTLDVNDKARIYLERIHAVSEDEAIHFEGLAAVLNLNIAYSAQKYNSALQVV